ncbi:hypothetical protein Purlil1_13223 [Purpureocillium lilacinum]|uniref:HTH psq-type domain-containing protein n=1 Tax=Purpureocillium lilacinum TaxID=33203 RepID=A0ABR0BEL8_PURLI|nr:hypothetical protein Purlil1_13223 [Purpureocillium lilacinum]
MAPQYTEYDISQALEAAANGQAVRKAAAEWGVPRMTLFNRLHGDECRKDEFSPLQRLSQTQENRLTEWVLLQDALGLPPHTRRSSSSRSASSPSEATTSLSENIECKQLWQEMLQFGHRSAIKEIRRVPMGRLPRYSALGQQLLPFWHSGHSTEHKYNMKQAVIMEGLEENDLVVGNAEKRSFHRKTPASRVWTSFIECVSATGIFHLPTSSRHFQEEIRPARQQWFLDDLRELLAVHCDK